jgi:hypothetical protein
VSIKAYCDTEESKAAVVSAFQSSGIDLVCAGVGLSRRLRMLQDLASFAVHHEPSNLMLISKNVSSDSLCVLGSVKDAHRNLLLAQIDDVTGEELSGCISSIWYWKHLSNGGKPAFQISHKRAHLAFPEYSLMALLLKTLAFIS